MKKVVLELDKTLTENELIIYRNGKLYSVDVHELLPELKKFDELEEEINKLKKIIAELAKIVKEK